MRAAVYTGARTIELQDRIEAAPGAGQVQIDVGFVGICGTDLHIFNGDMDARVGAAAVLGHEMSGRIARLGTDVRGWSVGQAATVMPLTWCGSCAACLAGHSHICHRLDFIGIDSPGAMQARWTVPAHTLVAVPDDVPLRHAALIEPVAVAVHDVRRAGLSPGERVLVVGGGPIGLLIASVASSRGADVVVVEPNRFRRRIAESSGLAVLDPTSADVTEVVRARTDGAGVDVAFEVSGAQGGLDTAVEVLAARGRLVLVAIHASRRAVDLHRFFWRELTLVGARLYERADFEAAVELVADGSVPTKRMISRIVPLREAGSAFTALEAGEDVMKILVDCRPAGPRAEG
jgi:2-desacetyl-2-hydroxyethyl bacteriochlorophyllide A dehydrogenase